MIDARDSVPRGRAWSCRWPHSGHPLPISGHPARAGRALLGGMTSAQAPASRAWVAGKVVCIIAAVTYGLLTAAIDVVDPHHLTNPTWPGHARFHLLWLIGAGALGALTSSYLFATARTLERVHTGALIGAMHLGGFFLAAIFKPFAGAEYDADGRVLLGFIPPAALHLATSAALLFAGVSLCRRATQGGTVTP